MNIYELVFEGSNGLDHTVVTADSEDDAEANWAEHRNDDADLIAIDGHGPFRTHDSFEEIRIDIMERGVPTEYEN